MGYDLYPLQTEPQSPADTTSFGLRIALTVCGMAQDTIVLFGLLLM